MREGDRRRLAAVVLAVCLGFFGLTGAFVAPSEAFAWDNCPMGLVNDPFPGACRRYVDTNGDDICDLSQSKPATTTTQATTSTTATALRQTVTTLAPSLPTVTTSGPPTTGDCPLGPCAGCGACLAGGFAQAGVVAASMPLQASDSVDSDDDLGTSTAAVAAASLATPPSGTGGSGSGDPETPGGASGTTSSVSADSGGSGPESVIRSSLLTHYNVSPIAIAFLLIYGVSFVLYKTKRMRVATHRKAWNVMLLATFLVTGIFGLILTIQLDYELPFSLPFNLLFWHVEAGVAMTLISLFHVGWHLKYYANLFKRTARAARAEREHGPEKRRRGRAARRVPVTTAQALPAWSTSPEAKEAGGP